MSTSTEPVAPPDFTYNGTLIRAKDGDTVVVRLTRDFSVTLDLGFHVFTTLTHHAEFDQTIRIQHINTPEVFGSTQAKGLAAKAALEALLTGRPLRVTTSKADKYGDRWLGTIAVSTPDGATVDAGKYLLEHGFATPYEGTGQKV